MATRSQRRSATGARGKALPRSGGIIGIMRWVWISAAAVFLALVLLIVFLQVREQDVVRANVTAFGVDLSGMTREEARVALEEARDAEAAQPVHLTDGETSYTYNEAELGLLFNIDGAIEDAFRQGREGFGASRVAAFWHLRGDETDVGSSHIAIAGNQLQDQLVALSAEINQPRIDPVLTIQPEGTFSYVNAQVGRALNIEETQQAILLAMSTGDDTVELRIDEDHPPAYDADYAEVVGQLENAFSGPITVKAAEEIWTFDPHHLANKFTLEQPANDAPARLLIDEGWVAQVATEISWDIDRQPQSARVWWDVGGQLYVMKEPTPGRQLDHEQSFNLLLEAFTGRKAVDEVVLPVTESAPPPLPGDLASMNFSSVLAEASTPYGGGYPARMHNIELAAQLLNGTVVMPGQTFSFNSEIGPMTLEAGFQTAFGIANNEGSLSTVPAEAGGICQVATTVFQPVFVGGYEIVQRSTHSYWIPNYNYNGMSGLDATVEPAIGMDFQWLNNSPTPVMVQAETDGQSFTVRLIGQPPPWTVEIQPPEITNIVYADKETVYYEGSTQIDPGKTMRIETANDGFDVVVLRVVREGDQERIYDRKITYGTSRNVVLVGSETGELPADFVAPE